METLITAARADILNLLEKGVAIIPIADAETNRRTNETFARFAHGYLAAATDLLNYFPTLHNELIETPDFVSLRRFARRYGF